MSDGRYGHGPLSISLVQTYENVLKEKRNTAVSLDDFNPDVILDFILIIYKTTTNFAI